MQVRFFGLWVVGCGLWVMGCELWVVGCGLWVVSWGLCFFSDSQTSSGVLSGIVEKLNLHGGYGL